MLKVFKKQIAFYRIRIFDFCLFNNHIYFLKKLLILFNNLTGRKLFFVHLEPLNKTCYANKITEEKGEKIKEMLKLIDMEKFENELARDLSYGQKRLIELSRTILNPHKFLMLDEPVAGVSPKLRNEIAKVLFDLKGKGDTILLIEHDMNFTLNIADVVIVMDQGRIIAEGTPEEIKDDSNVLEAYLGE